MRTKTVTVNEGEWLGDVPEDWDYEAFWKKYLSDDHDRFERKVKMFKDMAAALKCGKTVLATQSGDFTHKVNHCGLYDGWVFWVPRPCYSYVGPISGKYIDEFYNITAIRIEE